MDTFSSKLLSSSYVSFFADLEANSALSANSISPAVDSKPISTDERRLSLRDAPREPPRDESLGVRLWSSDASEKTIETSSSSDCFLERIPRDFAAGVRSLLLLSSLISMEKEIASSSSLGSLCLLVWRKLSRGGLSESLLYFRGLSSRRLLSLSDLVWRSRSSLSRCLCSRLRRSSASLSVTCEPEERPPSFLLSLSLSLPYACRDRGGGSSSSDSMMSSELISSESLKMPVLVFWHENGL